MATYRGLTIPNPTDPPDGPGAFLSFAQSLAPQILTRVDDFDELVTFDPDEWEGMLVTVDEGDVQMQSIDGTWKQITTAVFASAATRNAAYAKASEAYLVDGARVRRTDAGWTETYMLSGNGVAASGWYPVEGRQPALRATRATSVAGALAAGAAYPWEAAAVTRGIAWAASPNPSRLTVSGGGRYLVTAIVGVGSTTSATAQLRVNGATLRSVPETQAQSSGVSTLRLIDTLTLAAGDYIEVWTVTNGTFNFYGGEIQIDYLGPA